MAKEAYYFSHDSNARHDPKITAMRGVYGSQGYGWYWMLIEMMREADGYRLNMQSKYAFNAYAMQLQCECNAIASFVHDCIHEFELFSSDQHYFWSESLYRRMEKAHDKSEKARSSANARWSKSKKNANASDEEANAPKMDAIKKRKEKEIKDKKIYAEFVTLTEDEYNKLVDKHGKEVTHECIMVLDNYKGQSEKNKKKYSSDYRAILNWVVARVQEKNQPKYRHTEKKVVQVDFTPSEEERNHAAEAARRQREQARLPIAHNE